MKKCAKCSNYDLNDDPDKLLCDSCWRDATIAKQQATIEKLKAKLAESESLYDDLLAENKSLLQQVREQEEKR